MVSYGGIEIAGGVTDAEIYGNSIYYVPSPHAPWQWAPYDFPAATRIVTYGNGTNPRSIHIRNNIFVTNGNDVRLVYNHLTRPVDVVFQGNNYHNYSG